MLRYNEAVDKLAVLIVESEGIDHAEAAEIARDELSRLKMTWGKLR